MIDRIGNLEAKYMSDNYYQPTHVYLGLFRT